MSPKLHDLTVFVFPINLQDGRIHPQKVYGELNRKFRLRLQVCSTIEICRRNIVTKAIIFDDDALNDTIYGRREYESIWQGISKTCYVLLQQ